MWDNPTYDYKINTKILQGTDLFENKDF